MVRSAVPKTFSVQSPLTVIECKCFDALLATALNGVTGAESMVMRRSHQVLCGNIDHVSLGMPGSALSDNHLEDADLPHVKEMVADSLDACCMFKRQASVPDPVPAAPAKAPDPFADITGDLSDGEAAVWYLPRMFQAAGLCCMRRMIA